MSEVYTKEVVEGLVARYREVIAEDYATRTERVKEMADELNVTVPSLRGKLVSEGVYVAQEPKVEANGVAGLTKTDFIKALEAVTGKKLPSFAKATKKDVETVWNYIRDASIQAEEKHPDFVEA